MKPTLKLLIAFHFAPLTHSIAEYDTTAAE
jgi:hypothetical protein